MSYEPNMLNFPLKCRGHMQVVSIEEAEKRFSKFIEAVLQGEEIIITVGEKPAAKLSPYIKPKRRFGVMKGKVKISKDFEEPLSL